MNVVVLALGAAAMTGGVGYVAARLASRRGRWALALVAPLFLLLFALVGGLRLAAVLSGGADAAAGSGLALLVALAAALAGWWVGLALAPPQRRRASDLTRYLFSVE